MIDAEAARACAGALPAFSDQAPGLLPFLGHVLRGWLVCGTPVKIATGMSTVVLRATGLYESRQEWLDREDVSGGLREVYEACWVQADTELEADLDQMVADSMKRDK